MIPLSDLQTLLSVIERADCNTLTQIVQSVIARYHELFPDEDVFFLSLPVHDREERRCTLERLAEQLMHH